MKDELGRKIMKEPVRIRAKTYIYLNMTVVKIKREKAQTSVP